MNNYHLKNVKSLILLVFTLVLSQQHLLATEKEQIMYGVICDQKNNNPIAFATISLHHKADSSLISGTTSNQDGYFEISQVKKGNYLLRISFIGYQTFVMPIDLDTNSNLGTFLLKEESIYMEETVVFGERIMAKTTDSGTSFYMNKNIYSNSNSGVDILKHVPGVQVDLMQNITLEGSSNIKILVDGKERDLQYLGQLDASVIDRVEIIRNPDAKYDATITGLIHVILKEREQGMSGHVFSEIPTNQQEIYINPSCGINFTNKKLNLYTSYGGEVGNFDNTEQNTKLLNTRDGMQVFKSLLDVRQKNWKHRIHLGADYHLNKFNQFSLYAYVSPHNQSFKGVINMESGINQSVDLVETSGILEKDNYILSNYSVYFKHLFANEASDISFDLNYFRLTGENSISFDNNENNTLNGSKPLNQFVGFRMDYRTVVAPTIKMDAGYKGQLRTMEDDNSNGFKYQEDIHALYLSVAYEKNNVNARIGLRSEYSLMGLHNTDKKEELSLLPNIQLTWKFSNKQSLLFQYRRSIVRPHVYQLSPVEITIDPVSMKRGNSKLLPFYYNNLSLGHALALGKSHVSTQFYYIKSNDAIQNYSFINQDQLLESTIANLAETEEYGLKISAAIGLSKAIGLTPYLKLFQRFDRPNNENQELNISNKNNSGYEFACSSTVNLTDKLSASLTFQYNSPTYDLQNKRYSNAIYMLALNRLFKNGLKLGISSAIPFKKEFTYSAERSRGDDYYTHTKGQVHVSRFFIRLQASYQFKWGKQRDKIERQNKVEEGKQRIGF